MIYLILSILCSSSIVLQFKFLDRYNLNTFQAIVVNYLAAVILGAILVEEKQVFLSYWYADWLPWALVLGVLFIVMFYLIGYTTQKIGVTVAAVAHRLSLVIPAIFAIFLYNESVTVMKGGGILLAMMAVYYTSQDKEQITGHITPFKLVLPFIVFLGGGLVDTMINYVQNTFLQLQHEDAFLTFLFGTSFLIGILVFFYRWLRGWEKLEWQSWAAGSVLGIANYASIYFIIQALNHAGLENSIIFPVNNIAIVALSSIGGFIIFKERLNRFNVAGVILAFAAIIIMSFA